MSRQRKKKGRPVSGWIILDKPEGIGSTECVSKLKWLYQAAKCGHAGTLDPLASGMLPIATFAGGSWLGTYITVRKA